MKQKRINHYLRVADIVSERSYCERAKVGAVAVRDDRIIATGFNGTAPGMPDVCERVDGETLPAVIHAEVNLILQLAKSNETSRGCTVFVTRRPCFNCANLLLSAGVVTLHYLDKGSKTEGIDYIKHEMLTKCHPLTAIEKTD